MRMIQEAFLVHRSLLFTERWLCERGARAQTRGSNYRRVLLVDDVPVKGGVWQQHTASTPELLANVLRAAPIERRLSRMKGRLPKHRLACRLFLDGLLKNAHQGDENRVRNRLPVCKQGRVPIRPAGRQQSRDKGAVSYGYREPTSGAGIGLCHARGWYALCWGH
jgi:hypothetical protein